MFESFEDIDKFVGAFTASAYKIAAQNPSYEYMEYGEGAEGFIWRDQELQARSQAIYIGFHKEQIHSFTTKLVSFLPPVKIHCIPFTMCTEYKNVLPELELYRHVNLLVPLKSGSANFLAMKRFSIGDGNIDVFEKGNLVTNTSDGLDMIDQMPFRTALEEIAIAFKAVHCKP